MNPFVRGDPPPALSEAGPAAAESFARRCASNRGATFSWPERAGRSILPIVRDALAALTSDHCSYCDGYPIDATGVRDFLEIGRAPTSLATAVTRGLRAAKG